MPCFFKIERILKGVKLPMNKDKEILENEISDIYTKIDNLKIKRDQIEQTIEGLEKEKDSIWTEIASLYSKVEVLDKQVEDIETQERTCEILSLVQEVSPANSMIKSLFYDTRTTPIMDEFYNSDKEFLIFKDMYSLNLHPISLIVTKKKNTVYVHDSNLTMTNIKKSKGKSFFLDRI